MKNWKKPVIALDRWLTYFVEVVTGLFLVAVASIVSTMVVLRYIFNTSLSWGEELSLALMVWVIMLGAGLVLRHREHTAVEILVRTFPPWLRSMVNRGGDLLVLGFGLFLLIWGWNFTMSSMRVTFASMPDWPLGYLYMGVPLGGALISFYALEYLLGIAEEPPLD